MSIAGSISSIIGDTIVLLVTVRKTYGIVKLARQANTPAHLAAMLLRDGQYLIVTASDGTSKYLITERVRIFWVSCRH